MLNQSYLKLSPSNLCFVMSKYLNYLYVKWKLSLNWIAMLNEIYLKLSLGI